MNAVVYSFNANLTGEAVYFKGHDIEGDQIEGKFLVFASDRTQATLVGRDGEHFDIGIEQFAFAVNEGPASQLRVLE